MPQATMCVSEQFGAARMVACGCWVIEWKRLNGIRRKCGATHQ